MTANTPRTKRLLYDVRHNIYPYAVRNDYGEPDMTDRQCPDKQHQLPVKRPSPQLRRQTLDRLHNLNHLTSITGHFPGDDRPAPRNAAQTSCRQTAYSSKELHQLLRRFEETAVVNQEDEDGGDGENRSVFFEPSKSSAKASVGQDRDPRDAIRVLGTFPFSGGSRGQTNLRVKRKAKY